MSEELLFSRLDNFRKTIQISLDLLKGIEPGFFLSPYSVIPIISQILGLNTPLMGSGDSPYSITSIIFKLKEKNKLFKEAFKLPLLEKRKIIDEINEMIAPILLEEEDNYIELLINSKFKRLLKSSQLKKEKFRNKLKEKFAILAPLVKKYSSRKGDFAHIVHYGYPQDLNREYGFLEKLPKTLAQEWREYSFPVVNEISVNNFYKNGCLQKKKNIKGWIIFISNYTKELLENGRLRKRKILQAARLAENLGVKIIGMGGLVASFAQGGHWLSQEINTVGFTTGHAYTIGNIIQIMENCAKKVKLDIKKSIVAIVGAAGSIGSGCAKLLIDTVPKHIILVDLNTFTADKKLGELKNIITGINPKIKVSISYQLSVVKKADIVIVATNSPTSLINSQYFKKGAIVIDDSFPKNISKDVLRKRKDIILLEGGSTKLPLEIDVFFARNMPDLMDLPLTRAISCKEVYGCFAETLVLALHKQRKNYGLGYSDPKLAKDILLKAKNFGFSSAPFQCFDEAVEEERFARVARITKRRHS